MSDAIQLTAIREIAHRPGFHSHAFKHRAERHYVQFSHDNENPKSIRTNFLQRDSATDRLSQKTLSIFRSIGQEQNVNTRNAKPS